MYTIRPQNTWSSLIIFDTLQTDHLVDFRVEPTEPHRLAYRITEVEGIGGYFRSSLKMPRGVAAYTLVGSTGSTTME